MATNPVVTIEEMEMVPERYIDIITREFAYDPVRLPLDQDPNQVLYNRKTLQTIWETEKHARNPYSRQWFDIKSAIPQTELRKEMKQFVELHRFPAKTVIIEYSKLLDEGEMERHLMKLQKYVEGRQITENQWAKIWKKMNLVRLFCEFHSENIKLFKTLQGFTYLTKVISKTLTEIYAKEAALDVGKEIVRAIDVILTGLRTRGENSIEILGNDGQISLVTLGLIAIVRHVSNNNEGYVKIQSLVLRAFCTIFYAIDHRLSRIIRRLLLIGYPCALKMLYETNAEDISSEDLNNAIDILGRFQGRVLQLDMNEMYATMLCNAVIICISREIERSKEMSGFTEGQLLEAEMQARHNSEALEKGMRAIRVIAMEESQLATCILTPGLDIVKELLHMFQRPTNTENEDDEDGAGNGKLPVLFCGNNCETVHCVHYRVARDGLDISEAIGRKLGTFLDVEILRKFIRDRTRVHAAGPR